MESGLINLVGNRLQITARQYRYSFRSSSQWYTQTNRHAYFINICGWISKSIFFVLLQKISPKVQNLTSENPKFWIRPLPTIKHRILASNLSA